MGVGKIPKEIAKEVEEEEEEKRYQVCRKTTKDAETEVEKYTSVRYREPVLYNKEDWTMNTVLKEGDIFRVGIANFPLLPDAENAVAKTIEDLKQCPEVHLKYMMETVKLLEVVKSPHVIRYIGLTEGTYFTEYASLGDLRQYMLGFPGFTLFTDPQFSVDRIRFAREISAGVEAISNLKPTPLFYCLSLDHVLLGLGKTCKITGFCSENNVQERERWEDRNGVARPLRWLAPEAISLNHVHKSDIWGFCVLIWELFSSGEVPFQQLEDHMIQEHINEGNRPEMPPTCSFELYDLFTRCWNENPEERKPLREITKALQAKDFVFQ